VLAGRAPWLLALHLGAALALAGAAGRSLLRKSAGRARAVLWIACIAAGGVGAFVLFTLLEPTRARYARAAPSAVRPKRPVLSLAYQSPRT
jgi:hypothetical protein